MSAVDRDKWNRRYAAGAYAGRTEASALLQAWVGAVQAGRALDVACGAGRNALYLAERGFEVDGVDISAAALSRARSSARQRGVRLNLIEHDLDTPLTLDAGYQLILVIRYVNLPLMAQLTDHLAPGGFLIGEQHLVSEAEVIGPENPAYRVAPGQLAAAARGLDVLYVNEGLVTEPDGRLAALAQVVARRGSPRTACSGFEIPPL